MIREFAPSESSAPLPALSHHGVRARRGMDAVALLTVYLVLLLAVPSNITIAALGSLGRPSVLWGVALFVIWAVSRLQIREYDITPVSQPVRIAYAALGVIALLSFAAAMLRGQPADQVSPAFTALVRLLSWGGVFLVAVDGIRTMNELARLARRFAIGAGLLALLGILQFLTKESYIDFFASLPGLSGSDGTLVERAGVVRASGTAIHPLEYATALNAAFPLMLAAAVSHGFAGSGSRHKVIWWIPVGLAALSGLVGVSRSAIIGFVLAVMLMVPALPRKFRLIAIGGGAALAALVVVAVPGLLASTLGLFTGAGTDPSTQSRVGGLERAPDFIATSPVFGAGFGTFLPRYYIFDNQWVLIAVELGIVGVLAFAAFFGCAIWSALRARRVSAQPDVRLLGYSLAVALLVIAVLFAFFDGLSFPQSAGIMFLLAGLCGSLWSIGSADAEHAADDDRHPPEQVSPDDA